MRVSTLPALASAVTLVILTGARKITALPPPFHGLLRDVGYAPPFYKLPTYGPPQGYGSYQYGGYGSQPTMSGTVTLTLRSTVTSSSSTSFESDAFAADPILGIASSTSTLLLSPSVSTTGHSISSASTSFLASIKTSNNSKPTTSNSITSTISTSKPLACNHDNCIRAMLRRSSSASAFCSSFMDPIGPARTTPSAFRDGCKSNPSRLSSACYCLTTATETYSTATLPVTPVVPITQTSTISVSRVISSLSIPQTISSTTTHHPVSNPTSSADPTGSSISLTLITVTLVNGTTTFSAVASATSSKAVITLSISSVGNVSLVISPSTFVSTTSYSSLSITSSQSHAVTGLPSTYLSTSLGKTTEKSLRTPISSGTALSASPSILTSSSVPYSLSSSTSNIGTFITGSASGTSSFTPGSASSAISSKFVALSSTVPYSAGNSSTTAPTGSAPMSSGLLRSSPSSSSSLSYFPISNSSSAIRAVGTGQYSSGIATGSQILITSLSTIDTSASSYFTRNSSTELSRIPPITSPIAPSSNILPASTAMPPYLVGNLTSSATLIGTGSAPVINVTSTITPYYPVSSNLTSSLLLIGNFSTTYISTATISTSSSSISEQVVLSTEISSAPLSTSFSTPYGNSTSSGIRAGNATKLFSITTALSKMPSSSVNLTSSPSTQAVRTTISLSTASISKSLTVGYINLSVTHIPGASYFSSLSTNTISTSISTSTSGVYDPYSGSISNNSISIHSSKSGYSPTITSTEAFTFTGSPIRGSISSDALSYSAKATHTPYSSYDKRHPLHHRPHHGYKIHEEDGEVYSYYRDEYRSYDEIYGNEYSDSDSDEYSY